MGGGWRGALRDGGRRSIRRAGPIPNLNCQLLAFPRSLPAPPTHSYLFASVASSSQWLIGHAPMAARRLRQNQTNTVMAKLLGVGASHGTYEPSEVQFIKQDLINASVMGRVSWGTDSSSVTTAVAARHFFEPASETSSVIARFDDTKQSAAAVYTATGKGAAFYYAFYVGE
jgi:hypothetical protein